MRVRDIPRGGAGFFFKEQILVIEPGQTWKEGLLSGQRWAGYKPDGLFYRMSQCHSIECVLI